MSLNEVRQRAQAANINQVLMEETSSFNAFVPWNPKAPNQALVPQRYSVENRVADFTEIQPMSGYSTSTVVNSAEIIFNLSTHDISICDQASIVFSITNSTGGATVLNPCAFWVSRLEVLNQQSNVLASFLDIDLWNAILMLPRTDFEQLAVIFGTTTSYLTTGVSLADGASIELVLPILGLFNACRLHLPGIDGGVMLRLSTKPVAQCIVSGSHPTFTRVVALIGGSDESMQKRNLRTLSYKNTKVPLYLPFWGWAHFLHAQSLAASTAVQISLNGLKGEFAALFISVRVIPFTAANSGTYIALDSYHVADETGAIFCGNHAKSQVRSRLLIAQQFHNLAGLNKSLYIIPFSSNITEDYFHGTNHGFQVLKGTEVLSITPNSAAASTTYQIDVVGMRASALKVLRGQVETKI